jgi:hypothetical protein
MEERVSYPGKSSVNVLLIVKAGPPFLRYSGSLFQRRQSERWKLTSIQHPAGMEFSSSVLHRQYIKMNAFL